MRAAVLPWESQVWYILSSDFVLIASVRSEHDGVYISA